MILPIEFCWILLYDFVKIFMRIYYKYPGEYIWKSMRIYGNLAKDLQLKSPHQTTLQSGRWGAGKVWYDELHVWLAAMIVKIWIITTIVILSKWPSFFHWGRNRYQDDDHSQPHHQWLCWPIMMLSPSSDSWEKFRWQLLLGTKSCNIISSNKSSIQCNSHKPNILDVIASSSEWVGQTKSTQSFLTHPYWIP